MIGVAAAAPIIIAAVIAHADPVRRCNIGNADPSSQITRITV
ncbi:MAG: hypothetical protein RIK87_29725 [Fuerstiella sp.]